MQAKSLKGQHKLSLLKMLLYNVEYINSGCNLKAHRAIYTHIQTHTVLFTSIWNSSTQLVSED